jgi:hypothetical protein
MFEQAIISNITKPESKVAMLITDYAMYKANTLSNKHTYHEYEGHLPEDIQANVHAMKTGSILQTLEAKYNASLETVDGMNEVYISCIGATGSDKVFETNHIDGMFSLLPYCTVLRVIVALQGNRSIYTEFPISKQSMNAATNQWIGFDYNRTPHYIIQKGDEDSTYRIILKLHYIVVPDGVPSWLIGFYKRLHVAYNSTLRLLFVKSQKPNLLSKLINSVTVVYCFLYCNWHDIFMFGFLCFAITFLWSYR